MYENKLKYYNDISITPITSTQNYVETIFQ